MAASNEGTTEHVHQPVLVDEVVRLLAPRPGEVFVDATVGGAGHCVRVAEHLAPGGRVIAFDRDPAALVAAARRLARCAVPVDVVHARFSEVAPNMCARGLSRCDLLLADLGLSSVQLDDPVRGFSFGSDGPLDMRMDPGCGIPAATLVAQLSTVELARCLREYGEERHARVIAHTIKSSVPAPNTTRQLAGLVERAVPRREWGRLHPATRSFQALRIAVNDELAELDRLLESIPELLAPGGRAAFISFHSLEDRRIKLAFRRLATGCVCPPRLPVCCCGKTQQFELLNRRALRPTADELRRNPRARSAKLRGLLRLSAG
ncbi:MAG: 16S rRNA (cytosine(1402)-N(4))-methyltransferase RsmH [Deltaproteobacteria bacterium]|nr:16S rRNA (cytosine(1402)-N(4))-methyltransferase RsmH [Deltaproteobacteria bacterium]